MRVYFLITILTFWEIKETHQKNGLSLIKPGSQKIFKPKHLLMTSNVAK